LENEASGKRGAHIAQDEEGDKDTPTCESEIETKEDLLMRRVLLKPAKEIKEPAQRKTLFRIVCKVKGKFCKVLIHSGRTNNLVSKKMVEKLGLKNTIHPTPYKVSWLHKEHKILVNE